MKLIDHSRRELSNISIIFASSLPNPGVNSSIHAFSHSYLYDSKKNCIFIRIERAKEVGELSVILIHSLAHIFSHQWSDRDPLFLREFFKYMRLLSTQLFFSRASKSYQKPISFTNKASKTTFAMSELEFLFSLSNSISAKDEAIADYINLNVPESIGLGNVLDRFSIAQLESRLSKFKSFQSSVELRKKLIDVELKFDTLVKDGQLGYKLTDSAKKDEEYLIAKSIISKDKILSESENIDSSKMSQMRLIISNVLSQLNSQQNNDENKSIQFTAQRERANILQEQIQLLENAIDSYNNELLNIVHDLKKCSEKLAHLTLSPNSDASSVLEAQAELDRLRSYQILISTQIKDTEKKLSQKLELLGF